MKSVVTKHYGSAILFFSVVIFLLVIFIALPLLLKDHYVPLVEQVLDEKVINTEFGVNETEIINYVNTPSEVKGIYMTSWVAGTKKLRDPIVKLIEDTELNTIVIDIKDYSGRIVFDTDSDIIKKSGSIEVRINDLEEFIEELHQKNIYVIGREAVFQDEYYVKLRPDLAVKNSLGDKVWKDRKGISWIDPGSQEYWDYIIEVAKAARKIGFDEINFDYIRFPSDGDMKNISYPFSSTTPKSVVLKKFFEYLQNNLKDTGLKTSADLFGMTTSERGDMGIGQILENAIPYFDYISPMVYPSHYSAVFEDINDPESHPYETVNISMKTAVERMIQASSSPQKLRPWLQDFSLRVNYGEKEVKDQIQATYDAGLNSWLLWSPSNKYTKEVFSGD